MVNTKNTRIMKELLLKLKACKEAVEWAGDKKAEEVIDTCHRGDWLLWLAKRLKIDNRPLTLAKGHCANTVRHLSRGERRTKDIDSAESDRVTKAIASAISYGNGEISKEELNDTDWSFYGCFFAVAVVYDADAYASYAADIKTNHLETADICRKYLGHLILEKL